MRADWQGGMQKRKITTSFPGMLTKCQGKASVLLAWATKCP
jgi:hypothetical protein